MFERVTPEQVGVASKSVKKYISILEKTHLSTHGVIMIRHGKVFYENYWKPFHKNYLHRMYSVSKSFVSIAIGFLLQDGLIDLDAPAVSYLNEDVFFDTSDEIKSQTIRNMLMMCTAKTENTDLWFERKSCDRLRDYFEATSSKYNGTSKIPGTIFDYDSPGSFVLGCIVEIITGKKLMDFLRERLFDRIGVSKEAYCLECPGGHSWVDSAIICTAEDLARVTMFMMNKGCWNGEQILDREYATVATSNLVDSDRAGHLLPSGHGYGYLFWRTRDNSFYLSGMGAQFGIAIPDKDMIFVINSDNQGNTTASSTIINRFFEEIAETATDDALPENQAAYDELLKYSQTLELFALGDSVFENAADEISGRIFKMEKNPMGITKMKFTFSDNEGRLDYTNSQGDKTIKFGINKNVFGIFPQEGYSDLVASEYAVGNYYKCAASAKWTHKRSLAVLVQVIDKYFGRLHIKVSFTEDGRISVLMGKVAEDFMREYEGYAQGIKE